MAPGSNPVFLATDKGAFLPKRLLFFTEFKKTGYDGAKAGDATLYKKNDKEALERWSRRAAQFKASKELAGDGLEAWVAAELAAGRWLTSETAVLEGGCGYGAFSLALAPYAA